MNRVFLGPVVHWLIIVALIALGWVGGSMRFHVSEFNPFLIVLLIVTVVAVVAVIATSPPGRSVTRDPIAGDEDDEVSSSG